ncbi:hypothetical protein AB0K21_03765 [Streptosporangium sp. NPDC049248]|uniref:hypothetical protein n=1 Tax=Streptosporangium sp. NPDC049248 TaxID=3155651 RepID=UPI00343427B7
MSAANLPEVADALWSAVSTGGLERVGAMGTESAARGLFALWNRIRAHRSGRGQNEEPENREELCQTLLELATDASAARLIQEFHAEQAVSNVFNDEVVVRGGTIGISNGPRRP